VNRRKQVFYCHGCGCGGGLARLIYLLDDIRIRAATLPLRSCYWSTLTVSIDGSWHTPSERAPIWIISKLPAILGIILPIGG
jgi:hypothetical protein